MNYEKNYYDYLEKIRDRVLSEDIYTEEHHIVPRSLGGDDSKENKITLTAREHYLAHYLLWKFSGRREMAQAFFCMSGIKRYGKPIGSIVYEKLREEYSQKKREDNLGKKWPDWFGERVRKSKLGKKREGYWDGLSEETKRQWSESRKGTKNGRARKIINLDTGEVFELINDAAFKYKISRCNLVSCCAGRLKTCGGFHWAYYTE